MKRLITIILILLLSGCGSMSRGCANISGHDKVCIDGVEYIQFSSGVSVAYNQDGTIQKCNE